MFMDLKILLQYNINNNSMNSCKRCGYSTNIKCNFIDHLNRKTKCRPELSDVDVAILHPEYLEKKIMHEKPRSCEYCGKGFASPAGKYQHKKTCHDKIAQDKKQMEIAKELDEKDKLLQDKLNKLNEIDELNKVNKSNIITNNKTTNKTINSNNHNNTTNNTTINNIKLNIFGKENLEYLVSEPKFKEMMIRCLTNTDTGYIQLMDKIYFNKAHPENMNIKKTNSKDDYIKCFNGTSWDVMYSNNALEIVMDRISSAFYVFFDWIEENEEERVKRDIIKTFMQEVGHPLNLDFSGYDYDFLYDKEDENQIRKKKKILQKFCVLNIYNKSVK